MKTRNNLKERLRKLTKERIQLEGERANERKVPATDTDIYAKAIRGDRLTPAEQQQLAKYAHTQLLKANSLERELGIKNNRLSEISKDLEALEIRMSNQASFHGILEDCARGSLDEEVMDVSKVVWRHASNLVESLKQHHFPTNTMAPQTLT